MTIDGVSQTTGIERLADIGATVASAEVDETRPREAVWCRSLQAGATLVQRTIPALRVCRSISSDRLNKRSDIRR